MPKLADLARIRARGTSHPVAAQPHLADDAAALVERRNPEWAGTGEADNAVDQVLDVAELLAAARGDAGI